MLDLLVQDQGLAAELDHLAVDAHAREALFLEILEQLGEFTLAPGDDRGKDERAHAFAELHDVVGHLIGRLGLDLAATFGAMGHTDAREEQAQIVVDLGDGANGRAWVLAGGFLIDGNSGESPSMESRSGLFICPRNWRA